MAYYEELQSYQPSFYMAVVEMQEILKASGIVLDAAHEELLKTFRNAFIATIDSDGVKQWEEILELNLQTRTLEEARSVIVATIRGLGKLNKTSIKEIADSFQNGVVDVEFKDGVIHIEYVSKIGVPPNYSDFESTLEKLKPAHLGLKFTFRYNTHRELKRFTHRHLKGYTHFQIRNTKLT